MNRQAGNHRTFRNFVPEFKQGQNLSGIKFPKSTVCPTRSKNRNGTHWVSRSNANRRPTAFPGSIRQKPPATNSVAQKNGPLHLNPDLSSDFSQSGTARGHKRSKSPGFRPVPILWEISPITKNTNRNLFTMNNSRWKLAKPAACQSKKGQANRKVPEIGVCTRFFEFAIVNFLPR